MTIVPVAAADFVMRSLRFGPMRLTPYGLCAAVGLVLAMAFARRSARGLGLAPERVWDAGVFAIVSCFVASRLLLVLIDPVAFVRYPLLVLSLPSLTFGGMVIAALMVWAYLRRKRISLLRILDVFAAPAAVLAALLELGHALDGSELGMPMSFQANGDVARFEPVSAYGVVASLVLAGVLWRVLQRRVAAGGVAALGLILGGLVAFGLDTVTEPSLLFDGWLLEPGQALALVAMTAGALLWALRPQEMSAGDEEIREPEQSVSSEPMHTEVR